MKMLEMFCGTKCISNEFKQHGCDVFTVDFDNQHVPDLCINILNFDVSMLPWKPDILWASPDCSCFSLASVSHHWNKNKTPKTEKCFDALKVLDKTVNIILELECTAFVENPRCMTRKQDAVALLESCGFIRHTVTYCQYGDTRMKPTDIWTNNVNWHPKPMCKNGDTCHESAPRGSRTGTQGLSGSVNRSKIPQMLCKEIYKACV